MSRLTSAQVIALGEYLEPTFDPASLTVSQLLGVLGYHNVKYPTPYSKPKLAMLFNEEIKAKAQKLKKERVKKENSIASDDGIVDGATGQPLQKEKIARRVSRRLSQAPVEEEIREVPAPPPPQPKRRRASAQPILGGPSRKNTVSQPVLLEESEPEEDLPKKKVGRSRKTTETAGAQGRRVANTFADDSGWEDNNIFQSGAESSSPARPSPVRSKAGRKSAPRTQKSRKSSSAPPPVFFSSPQGLPSTPDNKRSSPFSPPRSIFEPHLPLLSPMAQLPSKQPQSTAFPLPRLRTPATQSPCEQSGDEPDVIGSHITTRPQIDQEEEGTLAGYEDADHESEIGPSMESEDTEDLGFSPNETSPKRHLTLWKTFGISILACAILSFLAVPVYHYKIQSASIGYCKAGSASNDILDRLRTDNETKDVSLWFPDSCTPCPDHAQCTETSVVCDRGFVLRYHPLLFFLPLQHSEGSFSPSSGFLWRLGTIFDGLPGFGSVAFPPHCIENARRKQHIGNLGRAIQSLLGQERGRRLCAGGKVLEQEYEELDGGSAKQWGLEMESLRDMMKKKTPPHLLPAFDDTFNEAIQQLNRWGGIVMGEDRENYRYLAHTTPTLTWDCMITVEVRNLWAKWRLRVLGITFTVVIFLVVLTRRAQKLREKERVAALVQTALENLRNQELMHHTDPVSEPLPYLSSVQLRDLLLVNLSDTSKNRLWNQVERVVEGNANVRANLQEIPGGDEMRVWRWIGNAGQRAAQPRHSDTQQVDDA